MGKWRPLENIRKYLDHHPPVVVFFLCLFSLAVTFVSFGAYSKGHDLENPDIIQDWNRILGSLTRLKFCVFKNGSEGQANSLKLEHAVASPLLVEHGPADGIPTNSSLGPFTTTHLSLLVPLTLNGNSQPANLSTTLLGNQLGLKGGDGKEALNLTIMFYTQRERNISGLDSETSLGLSCLRLSAPAHILPQTKLPPKCPISEDQDVPYVPVGAIALERNKQSPQHALDCHHMEFTPDPSLTVMLSQEERDLAGHHLMIVSAFLLVLCAVLCFLGSCSCSKSRRSYGNGMDLQKELLIDS